MSIRDGLLNILIGFALVPFIFLVAAIDSLPMWLVLIVAGIVWIVYIAIVVRDHARDIRYPIVRVRSDKPSDRVIKAPQTRPYNQEEDKE